MKRISVLFLLAFMICMTVSGCGKKESLEGYWILSGGKMAGTDIDASTMDESTLPFISLEADSKFVAYINIVERGKWEETNSGIKLTPDKGKKSDVIELKKEKGKLVLDMSEEGDGLKFEFTHSEKKPKTLDNLDELEEEKAEDEDTKESDEKADKKADKKKNKEVTEFDIKVSKEETQQMSLSNVGRYFIVPEPKIIVGYGFDSAGTDMLLKYDYKDSNYEEVEKITKLDVEDGRPMQLIQEGDYVYYCFKQGDSASIRRVELSGEGSAEVLVERSGTSTYLQYYEDRFYYKDENNHIVSVDKDFKNPVTVIDDTEVFYPYIIDGWIIYQDDADKESIHARSLEYKQDVKITDESGYFPLIYKNYLYYEKKVDASGNETSLCRVDLKDYTIEDGVQVYSYNVERSEDKKSPGFTVDIYDTGEPVIWGRKNAAYSIDDWDKGNENGALEKNVAYCSDSEVRQIYFNLNEDNMIIDSMVQNMQGTATAMPRYAE